MRMVRLGLIGVLLAVASSAWGVDGLVAIKSPHSPKDTMDRLEALLKHKGLAPGEGLWIVPCEGVHTFAMKFPIDVVFLNRQRKILKIRPNMVRGRIALSLLAHSVLELPAGTLEQTGTQRGDQLELEKYE